MICLHCSELAVQDTAEFRAVALSGHHPLCPKYDPKRDYIGEHLKLVVRAMEAWAADEDGIHMDAWDCYAKTRTLIGQPVTEEEP